MTRSIVNEIDYLYAPDYIKRVYGYLFDYIVNPEEYALINHTAYKKPNDNPIWIKICNAIHKRFSAYRVLISYQINYEYLRE